MASPYDSVSIVNYNANPPADDGSVTEANRVKWATIKTKLNDPLEEAIEDINTNLTNAFGKIDAGVTSTAISYQVLSTDQGKLVRASASGITITTPDAAGVGAPFVFGFLNDSSGDITLDGSGSQTIDGDASVTVPAGAGGRIRTDGTNWFTDGQNFQRTQVIPQGYLTLVSTASAPLAVFPAADVAAATAVYYRPDTGNLVPIPNGTSFAVREFAELTLSLVASHAANTILDVFAFDDAGTIRIGTGPAWTTATAGSGARGLGAGTTELEKLKGLPVNKVAATMRNGSTTYSVAAKCGLYLGSIQMDGTNGQVTCHVSYGQSRKWGVWNAYNKHLIIMKGGDPTSSWSVGGAGSVRAQNGSSANSISTFQGLADENILYRLVQIGVITANQGAGAIAGVIKNGIGINSTTAFSGKYGTIDQSFGSMSAGLVVQQRQDMVAEYLAPPSIGVNVATATEQLTNLLSQILYGTEALCNFTASYRG